MAGMRDLQSGANFAQLQELGCFDEEFSVYGYGYLEHGEIQYLVANSGERIYGMRGYNVTNGIYTTPIQYAITRQQVNSGTIHGVNHKAKIQLAKEIKKTYTKAYYEKLRELSTVEHSDVAYDLLCQVRDRIDGYFQPQMIQSLAGLCEIAYESKKITANTFAEFQGWIRHAKKQLENDVIVKEKFCLTMYGFAYEQNGRTMYFINAHRLNVYKKWEELRRSGVIVTPIVQKEYWSEEMWQSAKIRKEFQALLPTLLDDAHMDVVKALYALPSVFENEPIRTQWDTWVERLNNKEVKALQEYRNILHV